MIVVPVYNMILTPESNVYLGLDQVKRSAGNRAVINNERVVLVMAKVNINMSEMDKDSFYPIGISGTIREVNNQGFVLVRTGYRVDVENIEIKHDNTISLTMTR